MRCHYILLVLALNALYRQVDGGLVRRGIQTCRHDELGHRILETCSTFIDKRQLNSKIDGAYLASTTSQEMYMPNESRASDQNEDPIMANLDEEDEHYNKDQYDFVKDENSKKYSLDGGIYEERIDETEIDYNHAKEINNLRQKVNDWIDLHNQRPKQLQNIEISNDDENNNVIEDIKTSRKPLGYTKQLHRILSGHKIPSYYNPSGKYIVEDEISEDGDLDSINYNSDLPELGDDKFLLNQFRLKVEREEKELEILENYYKFSKINSKSKKSKPKSSHNIYKRDNLQNIHQFKYINPHHGISKRDNEAMNRLLSKCCHMGCRDNDFAFLCHNR